MKTLNLSPKVIVQAAVALVVGLGAVATQWAHAGTWDTATTISLVVTFLVTVGGAALGYKASPGEVVPKETPAFDRELPGGVTEEQRAAALAPVPKGRVGRPKGF